MKYKKESNVNNSAQRTLLALEIFSQSALPISAAEIAEKLSIDRIKAYRSIKTLLVSGYLVKSPRRGYFEKSLHLLNLTRETIKSYDSQAVIENYLNLISDETGECCSYEILESNYVVVVNKSKNPPKDKINFKIGQSSPAHCTSIGRAILAFQPRAVSSEIIKSGIDKKTEKTVTDPFKFLELLDHIKREKFAIDDLEFDKNLRCAAAPIVPLGYQCKSGIAICGEANRLSKNQILELGEYLKNKAIIIANEQHDIWT